MKIKWVHLALDDLKDIYDDMAYEDNYAAKSVLLNIRKATSLLTKKSAIGRSGRVPETRELVVTDTPFVIPYRVDSGEVQILRIFNGAHK